MKFEEALYNFKREIMKEYGPDADILKIAVTYECFDNIAHDVCRARRFDTSFISVAPFADLNLFGIEIVARRREELK